MKSLKEKYSEKVLCKGGGFGGIGKAINKIGKGAGRLAGNLTGGIIGKSDAEKAQQQAIDNSKEEARRQTELYKNQIAEENRRRAEEAQRAQQEAQRAKEEQERTLREAEERRRAEEAYNQQVNQDTGTLAKTNIQNTTNQNKTNVDYSNAVTGLNDYDDDMDKLKKAFKYKL